MHIHQFKQHIEEIFGEHLHKYGDQFGITNASNENFHKIGYATNLTLETIEEAKKENIDMMITHHAAWEFLYGMEEACTRKLKEYNINHFWIHSPLDFIEFGTCTSLFHTIEIDEIITYSSCDDKELPGVGEYTDPIPFSKLVERVESKLGEKVKAWKNNNKQVKRVGILTGAGHSTDHIQAALDSGCDTYITGEKTLYTVQYAQFKNINLIVGSHTFTEIFGVESLVKRVQELDNSLEIVQLYEAHIE
ncbi:Nif3-like dinuclear metal center hexameric protein [Bacillus rhizoplanae]|uniref:Nif3-like dinuclear metal center hexameric protein n=1 Tax=Bacillus rhizoplanae TaxID=2880966 RepID=UPI003D223600